MTEAQPIVVWGITGCSPVQNLADLVIEDLHRRQSDATCPAEVRFLDAIEAAVMKHRGPRHVHEFKIGD